MKKIKFLSIYLSIIFVFNSCDKEINIDNINFTEKLVLNGELNTNNTMAFTVSKNLPILVAADSSGYLIKNATVEVFEDGVSLGFASYTNKFYELPVKPKPGKTYRIEVKNGFIKPAYSLVTMPNTFASSASFKDSVGLDNQGFKIGQLQLSFQDNNEANYYELLIQYYDASIQTWFPLLLDSDDPIFINNQKLKNGGYVFSDESFKGQNKTLYFTVPFGTFVGAPQFEISLKTFPEQYYSYLRQLRDYEQFGGGINTDPVILESNVTNGLGMVGSVYNYKDTIY